MTLTSGDVLDLDLGVPVGREAGFRRPAILITAQAVLDGDPAIIHVAPTTTTVRRFSFEIRLDPDHENGLEHVSSVQCEHIRSVAARRVEAVRGNVGPTALAEVRSIVGLLLDTP